MPQLKPIEKSGCNTSALGAILSYRKQPTASRKILNTISSPTGKYNLMSNPQNPFSRLLPVLPPWH